MHEVDELLAGVHVEFGVDVLGVGGGRLARDDESVAHVRYRSAARQEVEHLGLARGEAAAFGKLEDAGGQLVDIVCRRGRGCSFVGVTTPSRSPKCTKIHPKPYDCTGVAAPCTA